MSTRAVSTTWRVAVILSVALLVTAALAIPVGAQTFQDTFVGALDNNCRRLAGGPFGPNLGAICAPGIIPGGASASAALSVDTRGVGDEQRLLRRLRERRDGAAASADGPPGLRGLGVFASTEYQTFDKDVTKFEPGYSRDTWGGTVGADYLLFGGKGLIGLAFSYSHQDGTFDNHGGSFDTNAYGPTLYGSVLVVPNLFIDLFAGYTRRDYTIDRRYSFAMAGGISIPSAVAHGETHGDEARVGVNAGYDFVFGPVTAGSPRWRSAPASACSSRRRRGSGYMSSWTTSESPTSISWRIWDRDASASRTTRPTGTISTRASGSCSCSRTGSRPS